MNRSECLNSAKECVCQSREDEYGTPEKNFDLIAELWTTYLRQRVSANDVAMLMVLLKVARVRSGTAKNDSYVDIAGYAACGCEITSENEI